MYFRQSVAPIISETTLKKVLQNLIIDIDALTTHQGEFFDASINLWTDVGLIPNRNTVFADVTVATFTGYAQVDIATWTGPVNLSATDKALHAEANFIATATPAPAETIYGYILTDLAKVETKLIERFLDPVLITLDGDGLSLDVILNQADIWDVPPGVSV